MKKINRMVLATLLSLFLLGSFFSLAYAKEHYVYCGCEMLHDKQDQKCSCNEMNIEPAKWEIERGATSTFKFKCNNTSGINTNKRKVVYNGDPGIEYKSTDRIAASCTKTPTWTPLEAFVIPYDMTCTNGGITTHTITFTKISCVVVED